MLGNRTAVVIDNLRRCASLLKAPGDGFVGDDDEVGAEQLICLARE